MLSRRQQSSRKRKYCKWHNSGTHDTNDCNVFRMEIQMAIDQGHIELEGVNKNKSTKIDGHPFPQVNMVVADIGKGIKDNKSASSSDAKKS